MHGIPVRTGFPGNHTESDISIKQTARNSNRRMLRAHRQHPALGLSSRAAHVPLLQSIVQQVLLCGLPLRK